MTPIGTLRVRVNITCGGTLVALDERGATVQLPAAQRPQQQTTLAIEGEGGTVYIPARVVRTELNAEPAFASLQHRVAMEFLGVSRQTAAAIRRIIDRKSAAWAFDDPDARSAARIVSRYGRVA